MTSDPTQPALDTVAVAVLAAGYGTRMKSVTPKHLHTVGGTPVVERVIRAGLAVQPDRLVAVVSPPLAELPAMLGMPGAFTTTVQVVAEGTAAAVRCALEAIGSCRWLVSLLGDSPLLTGETVAALLAGARQTGAKVTILTCELPDAGNYGRIVRNVDGEPVGIVEKKNDDSLLRQGRTEINSGIMVLDAAWASDALGTMPRNETTNEFLLTDLVAIAVAQREPDERWPVSTVAADPDVALGVNDRRELMAADAAVRRLTRARLLDAGVTIIGDESVVVDETVRVGADTVLMPFTVITGNTTIGAGCTIGPAAILHDAAIADRVMIRSSTVAASAIGADSDVGPYAHVRGGCRIGENVHIGTSAELKNSTLGDGSKTGHFSYIGDATLGRDVNIGAGTITANYDGEAKHATTIGDGAFIGSDTILVAPLSVGAGATTGAGSVVTRDVAAGSTVVGVPARPYARKRSADAAAGPEKPGADEKG